MTKKLQRVSSSEMRVLKTDHTITLHKTDVARLMRHWGEDDVPDDVCITDGDGVDIDWPLQVQWTNEREQGDGS